MSLVSAQMRAVVGSVTHRMVSYAICESDVRRWRVAVAWPDAVPSGDPPVAPLEFNPFAWGPRWQEGGHSRDIGEAAQTVELSLGIAAPDVHHVMNGGRQVRYGEARMRPGDTVTAMTRLKSYDEKVARQRSLLLTALESIWTNQDDQLIKTDTMTLIRF